MTIIDKFAAAGGKASAELRAAQVAKIARFRVAILERTGPLDPIRESLLDTACALYRHVLRASKASLAVNRRTNLLAVSAASGNLRGILADLGVFSATAGTAPNPDPPPDRYASQEAKDVWMARYLARLKAEREAREAREEMEVTDNQADSNGKRASHSQCEDHS